MWRSAAPGLPPGWPPPGLPPGCPPHADDAEGGAGDGEDGSERGGGKDGDGGSGGDGGKNDEAVQAAVYEFTNLRIYLAARLQRRQRQAYSWRCSAQRQLRPAPPSVAPAPGAAAPSVRPTARTAALSLHAPHAARSGTVCASWASSSGVLSRCVKVCVLSV